MKTPIIIALLLSGLAASPLSALASDIGNDAANTSIDTALIGDSNGPLLMARSHDKFDSTMATLQNSIMEHGYSVAHIQKCDGGMAKFGYNSDYYRVVFFGKAEEVEQISKASPAMIPYLPLKVLVFAEQDRTVLSALNPTHLAAYFPDDPALQQRLKGWENDLRSILAEVDAIQ